MMIENLPRVTICGHEIFVLERGVCAFQQMRLAPVRVKLRAVGAEGDDQQDRQNGYA